MEKNHVVNRAQQVWADAVWAVGDAVENAGEFASFMFHGAKKFVKKQVIDMQKGIDEYGEGVAEFKEKVAEKLRENY